jgi:hypothetical protein
VLGWILDLQKKFKAEGKEVNKQTITDFAWDTLKSGKVGRGARHSRRARHESSPVQSSRDGRGVA